MLRDAKGGFSSTWTFSADDLRSQQLTINEGSVVVKLDCCDENYGMQVASVVIENNTDRNIRNINLSFFFEGKEGFDFPRISTESKRELGIGQKTRLKLYLYDEKTDQFIEPRDVASAGQLKIYLK